MRIIIYILLCAFVITINSSCESDLKIDSDIQTELVVNCMLKQDEQFSLTLSSSKSVFSEDKTFNTISDARVVIYDEDYDIAYELFYVDTLSDELVQEYRGFKYPIGGETYHLEISHPDFQTIKSTTTVPKLSSAVASSKLITDGDLHSSVFNLEIRNEGVENYYIWELLYKPEYSVDLQTATILSQDSKTDNILPNEDTNNNYIFLKNLNSSEVASSFTSTDVSESELNSAQIKLLTVSEDAYNFYRSLELYKKSPRNYIDPIKIHSNIENGIGIFGAMEELIINID